MSGFMAGIIYLNAALMRPAGNKKAMLNMAQTVEKGLDTARAL